jgi:hypothetical protein
MFRFPSIIYYANIIFLTDSAHGTAGTGSEKRRGRLSQLVYLEQVDEDD